MTSQLDQFHQNYHLFQHLQRGETLDNDPCSLQLQYLQLKTWSFTFLGFHNVELTTNEYLLKNEKKHQGFGLRFWSHGSATFHFKGLSFRTYSSLRVYANYNL